MSDSIQILAGKKKSLDSINDDKYIEIPITRNTSPLINGDNVSTLDLNQRFIRERDNCSDYRLVLTINPYCTNVLFNACTEITKNEGSDYVVFVGNETKINISDSEMSLVKGKTENVSEYDMVRNTEYSKDSIGYEYHPGLDFFNNHILRNRTFRVVNTLRPSEKSVVFNTIDDFMRTQNGLAIKKCCRRDLSDTTMVDKHLYDYDNILEFANGDAVTENLREKDGWLGFYNTNTIQAKDHNGNDLGVGCAINNRGEGDFIDMYPDRSLFSFTPKYNPHRNRLESNWDFQITYPYENCTKYVDTGVEYDFKIVQDGSMNALFISTAEYVVGQQGENYVLFRTPVKHNLNVDDYIHIYYNEDEENGCWHPSGGELVTEYRVAGVGDMNGEHMEYYFYITDTSLLDNIFATPKYHGGVSTDSAWDYVRDYFYTELDYDAIDVFNQNENYYVDNLVKKEGDIYICVNDYNQTIRFQECFNIFNDGYIQEYSSEYGLTNIPGDTDRYIKVGNVVYELYNRDINIYSHNTAMGTNKFIRQIINNAFKCGDGAAGLSPAQSGNLWRDYISFRFRKTNGNSDCSYYVRKFKKVPNLKYGDNYQRGIVDSDFENELYPLAFSTTVYGDGVAQAVFTDNINVEGLTDSNGNHVTDIYATIIKTNRGHKEWYCSEPEDKKSENVEYSHCFGAVTCGFDLFNLKTDSEQTRLKHKELCDVHMICNDFSGTSQTIGDRLDITINDDWYYGDVVEFCPWKCESTTLCDVNFRFNTAQRELGGDDEYGLRFDEIASDDFSGEFSTNCYTVRNATHRREGYYYKPHYKIRLKGLGVPHQATHNYIGVQNAEPIQADGLFIKIRTTLKHNVTGGRVLLRDSTTGDEWWLDVVTVVDAYNFVINKIDRSVGSSGYRDWITICRCLNDGTYVLRRENLEIPPHASKVGLYTYIWRNAVNAWDVENTDDTLPTYVFANGCFYIDEKINFHLRRQDPCGVYGLYYDGMSVEADSVTDNIMVDNICDRPGDVISDVSIYEYKDESMTLC